MLPSLARTRSVEETQTRRQSVTASEVDKLDDFDSAFNDGVHAQDNDPNTRRMPVFIFYFTSRIRTPAVGPIQEREEDASVQLRLHRQGADLSHQSAGETVPAVEISSQNSDSRFLGQKTLRQ